MAHLVAGDWVRYGRVRVWGSIGFMVTVFAAGAWFERFGMGSFPGWAAVTLVLVLACTLMLPNVREPVHHEHHAREPVGPVMRQPAVRWFFASLFFHVMSHFAVYAFLSLYLDALNGLPERPPELVPPGTVDPIGVVIEKLEEPDAPTGSVPPSGATR